ncbi:MAG: hypothetical protein R3272_05405 [Candidatus Promineifilaceae bacterium]|nr:hypothetical protein [Candidatus Promineifilaceae bacterium]
MFNPLPSMQYENGKGRQRELERDLDRRRQLAELPAAQRERHSSLSVRLLRAVKNVLGSAGKPAPAQRPAVGHE